jgi:hypothetical protein
MQVPYYFVADFETLVMDITLKEEEKEKKTKKVQEQVPCSYSYVKVRYDGVSELQRIFTGKDAVQNFVIEIVKEVALIRKEFNNPMEMIPLISQEQATHDDNATNCWICQTPLLDDKVRDHCYITGKYQGQDPGHF